MRNPVIRFFSKIFKGRVKESRILENIPRGEVKDAAVRVDRKIGGEFPVYSLTLEKIPHGKVEDALLAPAIVIHMKIHGDSLVYNLPADKEFFIGRNPENDLCLEGEDVSDIHAKIRPEKEGYMLYDLASQGGVHVNWEKILKHKLEYRDRIKIGSHVLIFEFVKEEEEIFDGIEIRKTVRVKPLVTIKFLIDSHNKLEEVSGIVRDVSLDGARIETEKGLPKGSIIEAGISSSELPLVEVIAQVIWERTNEKDGKRLYDIGIQFLDIDEKSITRLKDYLDKPR